MSNVDRLKEIKEKYNLTKDDFWEMKRGNRSMWILTHDACERIAYKEGIIFWKNSISRRSVPDSNSYW